MRFAVVATIALISWVSLPSIALAGWSCSIDHAYPEVSSLDIEDGKLVAVLATRFLSRKKTIEVGGETHDVFVREFPRLIMSADGKWETDGVASDPSHANGDQGQCIDAPVDPKSAWEWIRPNVPFQNVEGDWFNQTILHCASDGTHNWGGIAFYGAEGGWGVGGLVKQNIATGEVEFVRPHMLVGGSTGPLAYFAGELWFGQYWSGECGGPPAGTGLKQLVFHEFSKSYRVKEVPEVCGFAIRDFEQYHGALWVATELGLSRLTDDGELSWSNYVPDLDDPSFMRELSCDVLYAELLSSQEFADTEGLDLGFAFDDFWNRLSQLRPQFVRRYLRELHDIEPQ